MTSQGADDDVAADAVVETRLPRPWSLRLIDKLVVALFAPVMLAALLLGGVRDWAWAPIAGVIGVVAVLVSFGFGAGRI